MDNTVSLDRARTVLTALRVSLPSKTTGCIAYPDGLAERARDAWIQEASAGGYSVVPAGDVPAAGAHWWDAMPAGSVVIQLPGCGHLELELVAESLGTIVRAVTR